VTDPKTLAERLRRNWANADILRAADMLEELSNELSKAKEQTND
jgi:hypothetical protein